ncbi:MAG: hypothetical protein ABSD77_07075 [Verrucomicrobiota bacterium]|jgi:enoyl-CoA hydratase/carnithine racemase
MLDRNNALDSLLGAQWRTKMGLLDRIDPEVKKLLTRAEDLTPTYKGNPDDPLQVSVLKDVNEWWLEMNLVRRVEDGELTTFIYSSSDAATINIRLNTEVLVERSYRNRRESHLKPPAWRYEVSPATVKFVREWVRRKALPQIESKLSRQQALAQKHATEVELMRKKYLP